MRGCLLLTALLVLCAVPAESRTLRGPRVPANAAVRTVYATATPGVRLLDGLAAYRCGDYAVFAGEILVTVRHRIEQGDTPDQAAEMASRGGADAVLAEQAAQAPAAITQGEFNRQALAECLKAAAERR